MADDPRPRVRESKTDADALASAVPGLRNASTFAMAKHTVHESADNIAFQMAMISVNDADTRDLNNKAMILALNIRNQMSTTTAPVPDTTNLEHDARELVSTLTELGRKLNAFGGRRRKTGRRKTHRRRRTFLRSA